MLPSVCPYILNQSIHFLKQSYPSINVCLYEGRKHILLRRLEKREATIGLTAYLDSEKEAIYQFVQQKGFAIKELFTDQFAIFLRTDHPLIAKETVSLDELQNVPIATYAEKDMIASSYIQYFNQHEQYLMNSLNGIMTAVIDNDCAAVCTHSFAYGNPYIQSGFIKVLNVPDFNIPFNYCLLYSTEKYRTNAETIVLQHLYKSFSQLVPNIVKGH